MQIRSSLISTSILGALGREDDPLAPKSLSTTLIETVVSFFSFLQLPLARYRPADFLTLRHDAWELDEQEYIDSFQLDRVTKSTVPKIGDLLGFSRSTELVPVGDLGYSGSTFFTTANSKYLIKALPRRFEHTFFTHDLFDAYAAHMKSSPRSLLVRIVDMVFTPHATLGGILGTAPTHHIVMENLLYGKECDSDGDEAGEGTSSGGQEDSKWRDKWETYDLKPNDYFFPERDILDGKLAPDSVKDKLFDVFPDKVRVSATQKRELLELLERDTQLLADHNAVDYSLFLVRYPGPNSPLRKGREVPFLKSNASGWRSGLDDARGQWTYRAVVLDFFWAKHKFRAKAMTRLVKAWDLLAGSGPMTITAKPGDYRERFLKMVDTIVESVEK